MKKSFSMIELIFAIIIIALAIGGLPAVLNQAMESTKIAIKQEAIWMASTLLFDIMDYQWDENSYDNGKRKAIQVDNGANGGDSDFETILPVPENFRRIGHIKADERRSFFNPYNLKFATSPASLGTEGIEDIDNTGGVNTYNVNDIDDYKGQSISLNSLRTTDTDTNSTEYKQNYTATLDIFYISDGRGTGGVNIDYANSQHIYFELTKTPITADSTNIKFIELNVTDCITNERVLTLSAFSCNIGEYLDLMNRL